MELTTHCPQCATAFLVSEDQLELAQGWVRCGVCQEVFMAQAHTAAPITPPAPNVPLEEPLLHRQETLGQVEEPLSASSVDDPVTGTAPEPGEKYIADRGRATPAPRAKHRWAALAIVCILLAGLAIQLGFDAYQGLAETQPQLALQLQRLCPPGRCALRQSSALAIEDSSLTSAGANAFHLKAMISNHSALTLTMPSLALTLTDAADEVLARKVYSPQDWIAHTEVLQASSSAPVDLWIKWVDKTSTARVAGYRLQLVYP